MRFLLDHDVPADIERVLIHNGYEVTRLSDVLPPTSTDNDLFELAANRQFILVTCNRDDFLYLAQSKLHAGLIVFIRRRTRIMECANILRLIAQAGEAGLTNNINFA